MFIMRRFNGVKTIASLIFSLLLIFSLASVQVNSLTTQQDRMRISSVINYGVGELVCQRLEREITITAFWQIYVTDTYKILNAKVGNETNIYSEIPVTLPSDARKFSVRDYVDVLNMSETLIWDSSGRVWNILLRQPLRENEVTTFTISYELDTNKHIKRINSEGFLFSIKVSDRANLTIRETHVKIRLPDGTYFLQNLSGDISYEIRRDIFSQTVQYHFYNLEPNTDVEVSMKYYSSIFNSSLKPVFWAGIIVALGALIISRWKRETPPKVKVKAPLKGLDRFVEAYRVRLSILEEALSLENRFRRGLISRKKYRREKKRIKSNLLLTTRELRETRRRFKVDDPTIQDYLRRIEAAEMELETIDRDITRATHRYYRGEISKSSYEDMIADYLKREEKIKTEIIEILNRLQ